MTLPSQQFARKLYRLGLDAGYSGVSALRAPQHEPARTHWLCGHTVGLHQRRQDMAEGSHPDIHGGAQFGMETGIRRGVAGGAKGR